MRSWCIHRRKRCQTAVFRFSPTPGVTDEGATSDTTLDSQFAYVSDKGITVCLESPLARDFIDAFHILSADPLRSKFA
jgi:hypothetical protein